MEKNISNSTDIEIEEFYKKISANIKHLREEKKMSQLELSLEIGIKSVAFYCNCENNKKKKHFNLEHIYKISKALGVSLSKIVENIG